MKNDTKTNVLAELRQREQRDRTASIATYREAVLAVARGKSVNTDDIAEAMAGAGHAAADFEAHVALAKRVLAANERVQAAESADHMGQLEAVTADRAEFQREREATLADLQARERDIEQRSAAIRSAKWSAERDAGSLRQIQAELHAALAGQPKPEPEIAPQPRVEVSYGAAPQSKRPADYDAFDPRWEMRYETAGVVHYYFNGKRVSA